MVGQTWITISAKGAQWSRARSRSGPLMAHARRVCARKGGAPPPRGLAVLLNLNQALQVFMLVVPTTVLSEGGEVNTVRDDPSRLEVRGAVRAGVIDDIGRSMLPQKSFQRWPAKQAR